MNTVDQAIRTIEHLAVIIAAYYQELIRLGVPVEDATIMTAHLQQIIFDDL